MKIKVSEATNEQLNRLVAECEGASDFVSDGITLGFWLGDKQMVLAPGWGSMSYSPSTNPGQGQPILERERICTNAYIHPDHGWNAHVIIGRARHHHLNGPSMLVAGLRCYVASKLGDEVEVPEELS